MPALPLDELEQQVRYVGADMMAALNGLPVDEQVPVLDRRLLAAIHHHLTEALGLNVEYRRQLADRLAGSSTPAQGSPPQSLHDPPHHATPGPQSTESPP